MYFRVLIVDDHQLIRSALRLLLEREGSFEVVAEAGDGREAIRSVRETKPHLVLMDIVMPGMNGIEATARICSECPGVKVLCLSMYTESRFVALALEAGASGYLLKSCTAEELVQALRTIGAGQTYLSPAIAHTVVDLLRAGTHQCREGKAFACLTAREREVLQLLAEGASSKQIARRLHLSIKTVGTHRERIMQKLGISSVAGLTKYAIREGLTSTDLTA